MRMNDSYTYSYKELKPALEQLVQQYLNDNTISFTLTTRYDLSKEEILQRYSEFIHRLSSHVYKNGYKRSKKDGKAKLLDEVAVVEQSVRIVAVKGSDLNTHVHGVINLPDWYVNQYGINQFMQLMKDSWWKQGISDINREKDIDGDWAGYMAKKSTKTDRNYLDSILTVI